MQANGIFGLNKFYFCLAASQKCTLYNGHGLCAGSFLLSKPATNHGWALSFPPVFQQGKFVNAARWGTRALNCATRRHKLFKYTANGRLKIASACCSLLHPLNNGSSCWRGITEVIAHGRREEGASSGSEGV